MAQTLDDWVGREQQGHDLLTHGLLTRFIATINGNDKDIKEEGANDRARNDRPLNNQGLAVPQGLHWCLCLPDTPTAQLDCDGHPLRGAFLPPVPLPRRMWAASRIAFHTSIRMGDTVTRCSTIAAVRDKTGSSGPLVFVEVDHVLQASGTPLLTERQTLVYRGAGDPMGPAPADKAPALDDWDWRHSLVPGPALLFRYSALTFNSHRIHYDLPYAQGSEGYRGLVVHGPLTATLLLDLAQRQLGSNCFKDFSFRGVAPAIADETLHLVGRRDQGSVTLEARSSDNRVVMTANGTLA